MYAIYRELEPKIENLQAVKRFPIDGNFNKSTIFATLKGALAQLARASRWQCEGHRFDSDMLHLDSHARAWLFYLLHLFLLDKLAEHFLVRFPDRNHRRADLNIAFMDHVYCAQRNNKRVVNAYEFIRRKLIFQCLESLEADHLLGSRVDRDVILQSLYIQDIIQPDLNEFCSIFYKHERLRRLSGWPLRYCRLMLVLEPFCDFINGTQETFESYGFKQIVGNIQLISFECIFRVGRGKNDQWFFLKNL